MSNTTHLLGTLILASTLTEISEARSRFVWDRQINDWGQYGALEVEIHNGDLTQSHIRNIKWDSYQNGFTYDLLQSDEYDIRVEFFFTDDLAKGWLLGGMSTRSRDHWAGLGWHPWVFRPTTLYTFKYDFDMEAIPQLYTKFKVYLDCTDGSITPLNHPSWMTMEDIVAREKARGWDNNLTAEQHMWRALWWEWYRIESYEPIDVTDHLPRSPEELYQEMFTKWTIGYRTEGEYQVARPYPQTGTETRYTDISMILSKNTSETYGVVVYWENGEIKSYIRQSNSGISTQVNLDFYDDPRNLSD